MNSTLLDDVRGMTLIEVVVWISVGLLLMIAVTMLFGRGLGIHRAQFEQVLITEDARTVIERMSDVIRNARNHESGTPWLVLAEDYALEFYEDTTSDGIVERVRFDIVASDLRQLTTDLASSGSAERIMARSVRNLAESRPLFTYYGADGSVLDPANRNAASVARVGVTLFVDVNTTQDPKRAEVATVVIPRQSFARAPGAGVRLWPVSLTLDRDPATSDTIEVTTTDLSTGASSASTLSLIDVNNGKLGMYGSGNIVNLNYRPIASAGLLPGWYAWIGPIVLGRIGSTFITATDQVAAGQTTSQLCANDVLENLLLACGTRTVSSGGFSNAYQPILTYQQPTGEIDYIREISYEALTAPPPSFRRFDFNSGSSPTAPGFIPVGAGSVLYTPARGYGWQSPVADIYNSGNPGTNLGKDFHHGSLSSGTYMISVIPGRSYDVRTYHYDGRPVFPHMNDIVRVNGQSGIVQYRVWQNNARAEIYTFNVIASDDVLEIFFDGTAQPDYNFIVNGIDIADAGYLPDPYPLK